MGLFNLNFAFDGDQQVGRTLTGLMDTIADAREPLDAIGNRIAAFEERQFSSQGGYGSGGWSPLSPRYAAWKAKHYPGKPILQRTGELKASLTSRPFGIDEVDLKTAVFGTGLPYSAYHQHGTDRMPMRKPLEVPEYERREWERLFGRWLFTGAKL